MEEKEVVLTSVEQFKEYLKNTADDKTVISVVLELAGEDADKEGGEADSCVSGVATRFFIFILDTVSKYIYNLF